MSATWWALVAGVVGLVLGGLSTCVVHRWPREEPLARGLGRCPCCGRPLPLVEMVPVASFLALRGRCRGCAAPIARSLPVVEAASGGLAAGAILVHGPSWRGLAAALLLVALVPVVAIDLEHRLIPDVIVVPATFAAGTAMIASDPARWWLPPLAALAAGGSLMALWLVHPAGMGLGDVKLATLLGAVLGLEVVPALGVAFAGGAAAGLVLLVRHGPSARTMGMPFAPFLAAGALAAVTMPATAAWSPALLG